MKNKCKFVGIMFLGILIVCTLAVMAYEHTAGMKSAAGGVSNASGNTKNTDEADDMLTVVTSFYPMYIATLNIVDGVEGVRLENLKRATDRLSARFPAHTGGYEAFIHSRCFCNKRRRYRVVYV